MVDLPEPESPVSQSTQPGVAVAQLALVGGDLALGSSRCSRSWCARRACGAGNCPATMMPPPATSNPSTMTNRPVAAMSAWTSKAIGLRGVQGQLGHFVPAHEDLSCSWRATVSSVEASMTFSIDSMWHSTSCVASLSL